jgi:hypothetical protein
MQLIESKERKVLGEGRNWGVGFGFVKKVASCTYETIMPISACKDYLNDVIYNERTGKPISACGLSLKDKSGIFDNKLKAFMVISILPQQGRESYNVYGRTYEEDRGVLSSNYENVEKFINTIEQAIGFRIKTKVSRISDNKYLVMFSKKWCSTSYLISLYSLLLRNGIYYDGKEDIVDYLSSNRSTKLDSDKSGIDIFLNAYPALQEDQKNLCGLTEQDMSQYDKYPSMIHNDGFYSYYSKNTSMFLREVDKVLTT